MLWLAVLITVPVTLLAADARNLALYRSHELIDMKVLDTENDRKEAEARSFLWENWALHRRAHLRTIQYSREGERAVIEYFIEPDEKGNWVIEVEVDREAVSRLPGSPIRWREKVNYTCTALERVEAPHDLLHPLVSIPIDVQRAPTLYRLHPHCGPEKSLPKLW